MFVCLEKTPIGCRDGDDHSRQKLPFLPPPPLVSLFTSALFSQFRREERLYQLSQMMSEVRSRMRSECDECFWCQPSQMSTALLTVDFTAGAEPHTLHATREHSARRVFQSLPRIGFIISGSVMPFQRRRLMQQVPSVQHVPIRTYLHKFRPVLFINGYFLPPDDMII